MSDQISDVSRFAAGRWLKGNDINRPVVYTISAVETVVFDDGTERLILRFDEIVEAMRLNGTQTRELVALFGTDGRLWIGQNIMLSRGPAFNGNATIIISDGNRAPTIHGNAPRAVPQSTPAMTNAAPQVAPPQGAAQPVAVSTKDIPF